jgi:hypothetical protein
MKNLAADQSCPGYYHGGSYGKGLKVVDATTYDSRSERLSAA